ncbi:MAG: proline racemase family protein, partial [Chloroflexi bacterium]|nr:proline racemase family protein [Chloroflexota bacterium]
MRVYCAIMRGGTSKGVFFHEKDLPADPTLRDQVVLRIFGSPDKRQIDGLGGADLLTSKAVIIRPSSRPDADVDYLFGQVSVTEPEVDWSGLCGNLSAAVGPFAVDEGLIAAPEPVTSVRIYCPAFDRRIIAEVPVRDG